MRFGDEFFKKVEKKTNVNKDTILGLAKKVQSMDMKDENNLRELIKEIGGVAGRDVSKEKEDKIVNAIIGNKVPTDLDKFI